MKIITLTLGEFATNTYIVADEDKGEAAVVDPASNSAIIMETLEQNGLKLTKILLTHGHYDHTAASAELGAPIYVHWQDQEMLDDPDKSFARIMRSRYKPCEAKHLLNDGDKVEIGRENLTVMHTPGHSGGSVMFIGDGFIFSGDTLFKDSVGRIDGWGGSFADQRVSMKKIKALDGDFRILPGHGEATTLEREKACNPFLIK